MKYSEDEYIFSCVTPCLQVLEIPVLGPGTHSDIRTDSFFFLFVSFCF